MPAELPGWRVVLAALLAAPDRTLTNTQMAALPGVHAFHQRVSDLRRYGYLLTSAQRIGQGYFAYALVGRAGAEVQHAPGLPVLGPSALDDALREAEQRIARDADRLLEGARRPHPPRTTLTPEQRDDRQEERSTLLFALQRIADAVDPTVGTYSLDHEDLDQIAEHVVEAVEAAARSRTEAYGLLTRARPSSAMRSLPDVAREVVAELAQARAELHPTSTQAEPEAPPAPRERAKGAPTGPQVMQRLMEAVARPMHVRLLVEALALDPDSPYAGAGVEQTVAGVLARAHRKGGAFVKVRPGVFALRAWPKADQDADPAQPGDAQALELVRDAVAAR